MNYRRVATTIGLISEHLANCPGSRIELESGVSYRDIISVESLLNLEIPKELSDLLQVFNGQRRHLSNSEKCDLILPSLWSNDKISRSGFGFLCGIEQILLETLRFRQELLQIQKDGISLSEYNDMFESPDSCCLTMTMLVISNNWDPTMICIETDSSMAGRVVAVSEQPKRLFVLAQSISEYFESILQIHIEGGLATTEIDGYRIWEQLPIDRGLWGDRA